MNTFQFKIKDNQYNVEILGIEDTVARINVNGESYEVEIGQQLKTTKTPKLTRPIAVPSTDTTPSTAKTISQLPTKGAGVITSPLPGKVLDVAVKTGDKISVGQKIICLEAMKMENNINSDREGVVIAINVREGDLVLEGDALIQLG